MKKFSSLIATLIVALVAFAQTPSATITMTIEKGQVILTPTPADAHVLCRGLDVVILEANEFGTDSLEISKYVDYYLGDSYERAEDIVNRAIELGYKGVSVTDHETVSSHIRIMQRFQTLKKLQKILLSLF